MEKEITMATYVKETPSMLKQNVEKRKEITKSLVDYYIDNQKKNLYIIACGSSYNAGLNAKPFIMKYLDVNVNLVTPSTFIYYDNKIAKDDLVMVISQTGCSTNSIDALKKLKEMNQYSIGLTANVNSDFKDYADLVIDFSAGEEKFESVTKGVACCIEFLMLFALEASLRLNKITSSKYDELVAEFINASNYHQVMQDLTLDFYEKNKYELTSMTVAYFCGFNQCHGIAVEGALKICETVKLPCLAYEAEEFVHGPYLQLTPNYSLFFVDDLENGSDRLISIYKASHSVSKKTYLITNRKELASDQVIVLPFEVKEPLLMPLYIIAFYQTIAYKVSDAINSWHSHPLLKDFTNIAKTKTDTITKIMSVRLE